MLHPPNGLLRRFFCGLAESTFEAELGVVDPPLVDYLSDLLLRFVRLDGFDRHAATARPLQEIGRLQSDAARRVGPARRDLYRSIGDLTLFWTGLFPEALRRAGEESAVDPYATFCRQGKQSYRLASQIDVGEPLAAPSGDATDSPPAPTNDLLARLAEQFEMCAYGLREVRRGWERREPEGPPPPLLFG